MRLNSSLSNFNTNGISSFHKLLIASASSKAALIFWLSLSLTFAAIFGYLGLLQAFSHEYVVQDDAVQHVFWMRRFVDPQLFPNDWIADYYQSSAPIGYTTLYWGFAKLGIDPIVFSKILPPILGLMTTFYCFEVVLEILPVPVAGFLATLLLNQNLWMKDDLASGTPRAFLYPLFLAFLYYFLRRSIWPCLVTLVLQGLFYPVGLLVALGILGLQLIEWQNGKPGLRFQKPESRFHLICLGIGILMLVPYILESSEFGPLVSLAQAKTMPEFATGGRTATFFPDAWKYWVWADRTGFLPREWRSLPHSYFLILLGIGLFLPALMRFPHRFPLTTKIRPNLRILPEFFLVFVGLFLAAQALLFKLYLPSRYSQHNLRILMAILAGITLTVLADSLFNWAKAPKHQQFFNPISRVIAIGFTLIVSATFLLYPQQVNPFPRVAYEVGELPQLYEFFQQQPKDIMIASLGKEATHIPTFTKRSILTAREYAIPYHNRYYAQMRERTLDLITAQYSPNIQQVQSFIQKYGIDFWIVTPRSLTSEYVEFLAQDLSALGIWIRQYDPAFTQVRTQLKQGTVPALISLINQCSAFQTHDLMVLKSECILNSPQNN
jgi:hypothetical protein